MDNDQARSDIQWEQIDKGNYRVIFPREYRDQASLLARQIWGLREKSQADLGIETQKIDIVLHATHLEQNGFVQLGPRKTEFFPIPSGIASNVEWLPNLAIHEWRHVSQMDKMTGRLRRPFFEQLGFALFGIQLPAWYFEGDAVATETIHSAGGRGRIPSWFMPIRTNELSDRRYSFDKNILGSFRDITPSFYTVGYIMNTQLSNSYGPGIRADILEDLRRNLLRPFSFYHTLSQRTDNLNSKRLYQTSVDSLRQLWRAEAATKPAYPHITTAESRYPAHYHLPQRLANETIALIQKPQEIPYIASIMDGQEQRITYVGRQLMPHFHLNGDRLIWDEFRKDARFGKTTFNVINIFDRNTRKTQTIRFGDAIYTPVLAPSEQRFAVVEVDKAGLSSLLIYDLGSDIIAQRIVLPRGLHIQQPQYHSEGERIIAIGVCAEGISLLEFDLTTGEYTALLPWQHHQIERPLYHGDDILYKAHYNGIDNIYRLNAHNGRIEALTDAKFGAFNPSIAASGELTFNDYAYDGHKISSIPISSLGEVDLNNTVETNYDQHETGLADSPPTPTEAVDSLEVRSYNPLRHLFNFHSLSLSSNNFENIDNYRPGLFWIANDLLNTSQIILGYEYDTDIRKSVYSAELSYNKYYPKFRLQYQNRGQIGQAYNPNADVTTNFDYREHLVIAEMQLPFSIYRRQHVYAFGFNFGTSYQQRYDVSVSLQNFADVIAFPLNYIAYFNRNRLRAPMDLMPKWGQNISLSYRHIPLDSDFTGNIFAVRTNFYFPGLAANHGLQARFGYQSKSGRYIFNNDIPIVSGLGYFNAPRLENTLLFTYRLPLAYPDWTIAPVAFIKRFTAEVFADYLNIQDAAIAPKTFGIGVYADLNAFRYVLPNINVGSRLVYINDASASQRIVPTFSIGYTY